MDEIGRPLENNGGTDLLEVARRYKLENSNDLNYKLAEQDINNPLKNNPFAEKQNDNDLEMNDNNQPIEVDESQKVPYIKGEVISLNIII